VQGWATDFIPKLLDEANKAEYFDDVRHVAGNTV
jgi:hypothetical protein